MRSLKSYSEFLVLTLFSYPDSKCFLRDSSGLGDKKKGCFFFVTFNFLESKHKDSKIVLVVI